MQVERNPDPRVIQLILVVAQRIAGRRLEAAGAGHALALAVAQVRRKLVSVGGELARIGIIGNQRSARFPGGGKQGGDSYRYNNGSNHSVPFMRCDVIVPIAGPVSKEEDAAAFESPSLRCSFHLIESRTDVACDCHSVTRLVPPPSDD